MANELKITDVVDAKAIADLRELNKHLIETKNNYVSVVESIGKGITTPVKSFEDLTSKAKNYEDAMKQLAEAQKQIITIQGQYNSLLDNVNRKVREAVAEEKKKREEKQKLKLSIEEAIALSNKEVHSIREAEEANKRLRMAVKNITDEEDRSGEIRRKLNGAINVNTDYIKRNRDALVQNKMTVGDYKEQVKAAIIELQNGNVSMKNFGIVAKGFGGILKTSVSDGLKQVGVSVGTMIKGFVGAQAIIGGIQRLVGALKQGIQTAIEFQATNSSLAAILGTTASQTKELQMQARQLGATTRFTAAEATSLQIELAKLGFTAKEISQSTEYVLRFAQATGASLPEAASLAGAALRMFGADASETERYVSVMALSTARSALSFSKLATALPIVGPVAKAFNFTIEDTVTLLGKLSDAGFDASMAATATRNILLNLADSNGKLAKKLGEPVKNLPDLIVGFQKLRDSGIDLSESLELTDKRSVAAFNAFLTAADKIMPLREAVTGVESDLQDMANEMANNTAGALKTLESAWEELMISINGNTGAIRSFIEVCTDAIRWLTELTQSAEDAAEKMKLSSKKIGEEAASDQMNRQTELINASAEAYKKAGLTEQEAFEKAKEQRINILRKALEEEKKLQSQYESENIKLNEDFNNRSFWRQAVFMEKTNNQYRNAIQESWDNYNRQISRIVSLETQIENIEKMNFQATPTPTPTPTPTTSTNRFESQLTGNYADYSYLVHDEENINKIAEEYAKSVNAAIQQNMQLTSETYAWMSVRSQQFMSMELDALAEQYEKGLIKKEEYEKKKAEITERYGIEQAQMAVDLAKEQLTSGNFTEEERFLLEQEIAKAEIKLAEKVRDAKIKATEETNEAIEKSADKTKITLEDALSFASETLGAISDLSAAFSDRELENIEKQEEANEEQYEKDIARIEKLEESGAISKEEAEARKRAAEEQTAAKEKELEKKRAEVQERQAKFDKAVSISQAIIATALGILQTIKNVGMPAAIPLIALQSALGAIQLATIIAQPIPKYAKGTKDHKGGLAIVGDGGKREAVLVNGEMYATPDVPTLVNLPKHAVVMPDLSKITSMDGAQSDLLMLLDRKNKQDKGVVVNVNNDYTKLEKRMDANSYELKQIKKLLKIQNLNTDRAMIYSRL